MRDLNLYKVYLVYGKEVVMHLYWAYSIKDIYGLMNWEKKDKPRPIIKKIPKKLGGCLCHHIGDTGLYRRLRDRE
jgi:hypothetical protein